ncbi:hypothetical protein ACFQ1I_39135 [Kitasatospora arboriphila]
MLFVEDPPRAAAEAERTLQSLLDRVGYPASGRIEALSVDHARRLAAYRTARETLGRADGAGADTEELRTALLAIRGLTLEVLGREHPAPAERPAAPRPAPAKTLGTGTPDAERPHPRPARRPRRRRSADVPSTPDRPAPPVRPPPVRPAAAVPGRTRRAGG